MNATITRAASVNRVMCQNSNDKLNTTPHSPGQQFNILGLAHGL